MKRSVLICILILIEIVTYAQIDSVSTSNYSLEDKEIFRVGEKYLYLGETYKSKQIMVGCHWVLVWLWMLQVWC